MKHSRRYIAAALAVAVGGAIAAPARPAHAGSKVVETVLYQNPEPSFSPNFVYGPDGSPIDHATNTFNRNPVCPHAPGVLRHGKVYVDTYYAPLHSQVRFSLYTTYVPAVAEAKVAIQQTQQREPSCSELYAYEPWADAQGNLHWYGQLKALAAVACTPGAAGRPNRWCRMQDYNARTTGSTGYFVYGDPAVDMNLDTKCAAPAYNGGTPRYPTTYAEIHDAAIPFANHDVFEGTFLAKLGLKYNDPVTIDDIQIAGGVANWDPKTDQPASGGRAFLGYGKVQLPIWSEWNEHWYDIVAAKIAATRPGLNSVVALEANANPSVANLATAYMHLVVQNHIGSNVNVAGFGNVGDAYRSFIQAICNASPWISDTVDARARHL